MKCGGGTITDNGRNPPPTIFRDAGNGGLTTASVYSASRTCEGGGQSSFPTGGKLSQASLWR